jgi:hypothetical protein
MRLMTSFLALCVLAVLPALGGCATRRSEVGSLDEHNAWVTMHAETLALRTDANSRLARALAPRPLPMVSDLSDPAWISAVSVDRTDVDRLDSAAAQAPESRPILAFRLLGCLAIESCDAGAAAESLARVDPGNGLALVPQLRAALQSEDPAAIDAALEALGVQSDFRTHSNAAAIIALDAFVSATHAGRSRRGRELESVAWMGQVFGRQVVFLDSAFTDVIRTCQGTLSQRRETACSQVRALLMRSDSYTVQMVAAGQASRRAVAGSPEAAMALELRRRADWFSENLRSVYTPKLRPKTALQWSNQQLTAMRTHARESDSYRAVMIAMNVNPDPPDDWKSRHELEIGNYGRD